ncbi:N-acetylmuramoyl-L-alanine amidase [Mycoplasmatota bacterium WC44]
MIINTKEDTVSIYIDPGHGGRDGGASGSDGTKEDEIALEVSLLLREYFEGIGITVYMTRDGDYDLATQNRNRKREDIQKRVNLVNTSDVDMYLSIHLNAIGSSKWRGAQTFYYGSKNKELAETIQGFLVEKTDTYRKAKKISNIYLLEHANKEGVLIEIGFLSNQTELELLKTNKYQDQLAHTIYLGVLEYLSSK